MITIKKLAKLANVHEDTVSDNIRRLDQMLRGKKGQDKKISYWCYRGSCKNCKGRTCRCQCHE